VARILLAYTVVRVQVGRTALPALVDRLTPPSATPPRRRYPAAWLGTAVNRALRYVSRDPTCLWRSLVLFRLLRAQGDPAVLVIGLPDRPVDERAHAWVELEGRDVGPPPGRGEHVELARYG
jgi:hypothetical protein